MKTNDLTGHRYGKLYVVRRSDNIGKKVAWLCRCDCGAEKVVLGTNLQRGLTKSCGCYRRDYWREAKTKYPKRSKRLSRIYTSMKDRCYKETDLAYSYYGGRGIKVCDEWRSDPGTFYAWAYSTGYNDDAPRGECTLDRIDVNGDYFPNNCRWISSKEQARNRRSNRVLSYKGEKHCLVEWAEICGIRYSVLRNRVHSGWSIERALSEPVHNNNDRKELNK